MKNQLSANLIALMNKHHIGGIQLARAVNIPLSTIKNIRKGVNVNPTIETLIPLARYFNVSLDDIIGSNLLVEKAAIKKSGYSQNTPQSLPIISWDAAIDWPHSGSIDSQVFTEKLCGENAFALYSEQKASEIFAGPGIFLIDPQRTAKHFDYVLVHKLGLARASIKQILCDEESCYLKSLVVASKLEPLDKNYRLLGVIIEYRQFINSLLDENSKGINGSYSSSNEEVVERIL